MQKSLQNFIKTKETNDLAHIVRPRKLSVRSKRIIKRISSINNGLFVPQVTCKLISGCSAIISASTVRSILRKYGTHSFGSTRKPFITITQRQRRMLLPNKYKKWNFRKWKNVDFIDETISQSYSSHGRYWVLRTANNRGKPRNNCTQMTSRI